MALILLILGSNLSSAAKEDFPADALDGKVPPFVLDDKEEPPSRPNDPDGEGSANDDPDNDGSSAKAEIPLHQWVNMEPNKAMGPEESHDDTEPDYREFSSMEATDDGRIIYWGGGHNGYGGNDMDVYHVGDNEWRQETEEENWKDELDSWDHLGSNGQPTKSAVEKGFGGGTTYDFLTGRGRPGTRHVYQQIAWWPEKGWFVFDYKHSLWAWDPDQGDANGAFMKIYDGQTKQTGGGIIGWNIAHDPKSGSLVSFNYKSHAVYRLQDGEWKKVMDLPHDGGEVYSEYHKADSVHYVATYNNLKIVDLESRTVENVPDSPPQAAGKNGMWFEYSPSREQMLVMGFDESGLGLWGYNPEQEVWEAIPMDGQVGRGGEPITEEDIRWDMLERDPVSGNFIFLAINKGRSVTSTYAFRLAEDAGGPVPSDPSPHPTNQWVSLPIPDQPDGLPRGHGKDFQMEWRAADGKVYICCGDWGQNNGIAHNGNEHLIGLDAETNTWTIEHDHCSGAPQPGGWDEVAVAYDSKRDELWGFPGFSWIHGDCDTDIPNKTMAYNFEKEEWRVTGHGHLYTHDDIGFGDYDPVTDRFYSAERPGVDEIDPERPEAGIVASYSDGSDYHVNSNQAFLDVRGRGFYITASERQSLVRFDLADHSFTEVSEIPPGTVVSNAYAVWDPNHRVILAPIGNKEAGKPASGKVHVYHVDTAQWQIIEYPYDGTKPFGNSVGYDTDSHLLIQMGTKDGPWRDAFVLEYEPQTTGAIESWVTEGETDSQVSGETLSLSVESSSKSGRKNQALNKPNKNQETRNKETRNKETRKGISLTSEAGGSGANKVRLVFPRVDFLASRETVKRGHPVTLSWRAQDADDCKASGDWDGDRALEGERKLFPSQESAYHLECRNEVGDTRKTVTVSVRKAR